TTLFRSLQEPERRSRRALDRGRRVEGRARRAGPHLGAARELHRERGRGTRRGREGADGRGPAGGVGTERGMAGARGSARRELVARLVVPRRNRRRGTGPGVGALWRALSVALPGAFAIGLALAAWPHVRGAAARHPYFAVREVVVRDHHRLPADEVRAAAGIAPGTSIWEVDAAAAEARLAGHRWIRAARVHRELPHRIVIEVREERPLEIVALEDGKGEYYVSSNGHLFAPVEESDARGFPYHTGLTRADHEDGATFCKRALHRALALVRQSGGVGVSEVHVD